jgi:hypothetical protein
MKDKHIFSEEELKSLFELGEVLRKIRSRLLAEGKIKIDENGKTIFWILKRSPKNSVYVR